jgi:exopolyphosphatase/guanosine-5'-triphosphate,3'-diphosphate pyrophosphatase
MRLAVIDLGTNTFNLLIGECFEDNTKIILHDSKTPVKLGKGGIHNGIITPAALERAFTAIDAYHKIIAEYTVDKTIAFATSAIRDALNGKDFLMQVESTYDIATHLITGDKEAELINLGVKSSGALPKHKNALILDIGGGSNEFIITQNGDIRWKKSFQLGTARIIEQFEISDPITSSQIEALNQYFNDNIKPLFEAVLKFPIDHLIGASGAFETYYTLIQGEKLHTSVIPVPTKSDISLEDFNNLYQKLIHSTAEQRLGMKGMELARVEMIVPAAVFTKFVLSSLDIKRLTFTNYSLKEGAFFAYFEDSLDMI